MKYCACGSIIKNYYSKRCRDCYLKNPDRGWSHNYSKEELEKRAINMSQRRKSGKIKTWNKGKDLKTERPDICNNLSNKLKGKRCNPKGEFKKGHKLSLLKRGSLINKHHKDLDKLNNKETNLLFLSNSEHNRLHKRAYDYLVETNQITSYIKWFIKKFQPTLYNYKEYKKINQTISKNLRRKK